MRRHGGKQRHNVVVFVIKGEDRQAQFRHILQGSCRAAVVIVVFIRKNKQDMRGYS